MRFRSIIAAGAMALVAGGAVAATAGAASAATPSAGQNAVEPYVHTFGKGWVLDVQGGVAAQHQPIILWRASNTDKAEDFTPIDEGTVQDFRDAGLVSAAFNLHYGSAPAYELEYTPYGAPTDLCVGTWPGQAPASGYKLRLEPCGVGATTVLAIVHAGSNGNGPGFYQVLDGAGTNFSHPLGWTWPSIDQAPTDYPRPVVNVQNILGFSNGSPLDTQQWSARIGVVH